MSFLIVMKVLKTVRTGSEFLIYKSNENVIMVTIHKYSYYL